MPNWCENQWEFHGESRQVKQAFELMTEDAEPTPEAREAGQQSVKRVTFNKIIPMPEILRHTGQGGRVISGREVKSWFIVKRADWSAGVKEDAVRLFTPEEEMQLVEIGFSDWYRWSLARWGCKWDASTSEGSEPEYIPDGDGPDATATFKFETPWGPPEQVCLALRERFPDVDMELFWREPGVSAAGYL